MVQKILLDKFYFREKLPQYPKKVNSSETRSCPAPYSGLLPDQYPASAHWSGLPEGGCAKIFA
jgi:hypothetical protein